jgi:uncharacterized protein YdbL (DUF1318 family)
MTSPRPTRSGIRRLAAVSLAALLVLLVAASAQADALSDAKAQGSVGERPDGYLGVVSANATADGKALADSINAKRRQHYAKIAAKEGIDTAAVAARAGAKLRERAAPGHYVMAPGGSWTQLK